MCKYKEVDRFYKSVKSMEYKPKILERIADKMRKEYIIVPDTDEVLLTVDVTEVGISGFGHYELVVSSEDYIEMQENHWDTPHFINLLVSEGKFVLDDTEIVNKSGYENFEVNEIE